MHAVVDGRWKLSSAYRVAHDGLESSGNNMILVTRPPGGAMAGDRPRSREQAHVLASLLNLVGCGSSARALTFQNFPQQADTPDTSKLDVDAGKKADNNDSAGPWRCPCHR